MAPCHIVPDNKTLKNNMVNKRDKHKSVDAKNVSQEEKREVEKPIKLFQSAYDRMAPTKEGRVIYISRHGESMYNLDNRIGGNPSLSPRGKKYARALASHVNQLEHENLKVWISELDRTHQTSAEITAKKEVLPELNEIGSGIFDHLTYEELEKFHPVEFTNREANKLTYRYPQGESYIDVCKRLEPLLPRLDDHDHDLLIVTHQAVIRCILSFLLKSPAEEVPYIKVPLHTVLEITYRNGKNHVEYHRLPVDCVDTYRPRLEVLQQTHSELKKPTSNNRTVENLLNDQGNLNLFGALESGLS